MEAYEFLLADNKDIPEIVSLYNSLVGTTGCSWNMDYPDYETARGDVEAKALYILKQDGRIIAAVSAGEFNELNNLEWASKNPCELARLCVMPELQGRGIGKITLENIIGVIKERGFDGIIMLVTKINTAALALYEKNGFERRGEVFMFDLDFYCYEMKFNAIL